MPIFKLRLGGKIGNGKQYFSFIHITDLLKIIEQKLNNSFPIGVYNMVAPEVLTNSEFTKQLAQSLHKLAFLKIPKFILKILYGEGARILIGGQAAIPAKLLENGYKFEFGKLKDVLKAEM
jgi:NAD dependent epimerase/dehydratase family enzyme